MAFHLRPDESVSHGLRRLAGRELKAAEDVLRSEPVLGKEAVHEARKALKKVRAVQMLVRSDKGRGLKGSRRRIRSISHVLSPIRDAEAILEILTALRKRTPGLLSEHAYARLRRLLSSRTQELMTAAERDDAWGHVIADLHALRRSAKRWRPAHKAFRAMAPGIRKSYDRGRTMARRARKTGDAADFHRWRKHIKALWYELRLLDCPGTIDRHVKTLHQAQSLLGDDHNLFVLCSQLSRQPSPSVGNLDLDRLRHAAARYQNDLRKRAMARLARFYTRSPKMFVRGIKSEWEASRQPKRRSDVTKAA